jgi:hypothetical protein
MGTSYKIDKQRKPVLRTYSGAITMALALEHQDKLLNEPDFDPSYSQLFDVTHITDAQLSAADIQTLAARTVFSPSSRRAVLVRSDLQFGLARIFELFRESKGDKGIHIFRKLEEALEWIWMSGKGDDAIERLPVQPFLESHSQNGSTGNALTFGVVEENVAR